MNFANQNIGILFKLGGRTVYITESLLATWVVMGLLILLALMVRILLRNFKHVPRRLQNAIEAVVEFMSNWADDTMGPKLGPKLGGVFFSIFAFILASNYSGMFGLRPPTSDLGTAVALGLTAFVLIHGVGLYYQRGNYFKSYLEPYAIFLPINLISEVSKPISLAFRLFGNILGGVIIVGIVYEMLPFVLRFLLPSLIHAYFDVFVGALQAYIFTMLSMTFIKQKVELD